MRLTPRHKHGRRPKAPSVSITQEEITADLFYPANPRAARARGAATSGRSTR
jgi:hypothetical protein